MSLSEWTQKHTYNTMKLWVYLFNEHLFVFIYRDVMLYCVLFYCVLIDVVVVVVVVIRCCVCASVHSLGSVAVYSVGDNGNDVQTNTDYIWTMIYLYNSSKFLICLKSVSHLSISFRSIPFVGQNVYFHLVISVSLCLCIFGQSLSRGLNLKHYSNSEFYLNILWWIDVGQVLPLVSNDFLLREMPIRFSLSSSTFRRLIFLFLVFIDWFLFL